VEAIRLVDSDYELVDSIIKNWNGRKDFIISILQDIQSEFSYLPEGAIRQVAASLGVPLIQVYGVATFFKAFSLKPKGRHNCTVCMGTACHVRGAERVLEEMERELGIQPGDTTDDMEYSLETVNCVGACALGPVVIVDGIYNGQMNSSKVKKVLKIAKKGAGNVKASLKNIPSRNPAKKTKDTKPKAERASSVDAKKRKAKKSGQDKAGKQKSKKTKSGEAASAKSKKTVKGKSRARAGRKK
jgi:NADH-quinone oxidoreductase subunit E